jgi:hypothetical protein
MRCHTIEELATAGVGLVAAVAVSRNATLSLVAFFTKEPVAVNGENGGVNVCETSPGAPTFLSKIALIAGPLLYDALKVGSVTVSPTS